VNIKSPRNSIAFSTTLFPMEESFVLDFFSSLDKQSFSSFDLIILNDGFGCLDNYRALYPRLNIVELNYSDTPSRNREYSINYIKESGYEAVIFGDSDDKFDSNRISKSLELLKDYDVVVNDVSLFNTDKIFSTKYMSNRMDNNMMVDLNYIRDKNIMGLSNTAVKLSVIDNVEFNEDLVAWDWYFFSNLLQNNIKAIFTSDVVTFYRQHQLNIAGLGIFSEDSIKKTLSVKRKHYKLMSAFDSYYDKLFQENECVFDLIKDTNRLKQLLLKNQESLTFPLWWELIV